jgi:hypothetical protein
VVVDDIAVYAETVRAVLRELMGRFGYDSEFCYNYWMDHEPYNAIRSRLWSAELEAWCFVVFHTTESIEYSEARLAFHQQCMGIVFHTATFDEGKTADAIQRLRNDTSWVAKVALMAIPPNVDTVGQVVMSPTTMATQTQPDEKAETDGKTMPQADTGCWHHKVCYKPVDTDEEGVSELPADIRLPASEARRAEEAGHIDRAGQLYALAGETPKSSNVVA